MKKRPELVLKVRFNLSTILVPIWSFHPFNYKQVQCYHDLGKQNYAFHNQSEKKSINCILLIKRRDGTINGSYAGKIVKIPTE